MRQFRIQRQGSTECRGCLFHISGDGVQLPWIQFANAFPGSSSREIATASLPRSNAAETIRASVHQGLQTRIWQVKARPESARGLRRSLASAARNHRCASAVNSARYSRPSAIAARDRASSTPGSATQSDNSVAACRFEEEDLELSGDLLGYILLNRSEIIIGGFMSTCP